jgi:glycosyltransferase involved in cell wall biosynthesis
LNSSNYKLYNSEFTKGLLETYFNKKLDGDVVGLPLSKKYEVELPSDLEEFFSIKDSEAVIGIIGHLTKGKGPNDIPKIFDGLMNYKLIIVGRSIDSEQLDIWSKNNPRVLRVEEVSRQIALSITEKCDFLLTTSNLETFGYSVAEGLLMGKPYIVKKNAGALSELISHGNNGFIANDIGDFKKYIQVLIDDKELRARLGSNAKNFVERNYEAGSWVKKLLKILC